MAKKNYRRNPKYAGKNFSRVQKGSKVLNQQSIRMQKINGVDRPCVVYKYRGQRKVHVLEDWRLAQLISMAKAEQHFKSLPKQRQESDLRKTSKNQLEIIEKDGKEYVKDSYLTESGPSRYDIQGIDTKIDDWMKEWEKTELIQKQREKITEIRKIDSASKFRMSITETRNELNKVENLEMRLKLAKLYEKEYSEISEKYDTYITRTEISRLSQIREKTEKELETKKRYPVDRKKILTLHNKLSEEKDWDVGYEGFGDNVLMHKSKISLITTQDHFKDIPLSGAYGPYEDDVKKVKLENSYLYGDLISFEKEGAQYHKPFLDEALKKFDNPKIYYKKDYPLLIKEDDYVMLVSPRIRDDEDESNEFEIPYKEYQAISKANTKKDVTEKIRDINPDYSYKKSATKDQLLWDYLILLRKKQKRE